MKVRSRVLFLSALIGGIAMSCGFAQATPVILPDPAYDAPLASHAGTETLVVAGGCFWGVQAVFQHLRGVTQAVSGYAGGDAATAQYERVSGGGTGHAESVRVTYDPARITPGQVLKVFFAVAHDPTQLNRQGPDHGTQYRSAIFVSDAQQRKIAESYIAQLDAAKVFSAPIATKVEPLTAFYEAEAYHQDYARLHPSNPYIVINDAPKVAALAETFPTLYVKAT